MLNKIKEDIKKSLLGGDKFRAEALKMVHASLVNGRIAKGSELTDSECIAIIQKEIKKRKEASSMYQNAGSLDRAESENRESDILSEYVPAVLAGEELEAAVDKLIGDIDMTSVGFSDLMKMAVGAIENADKAELAKLLKQKIG